MFLMDDVAITTLRALQSTASLLSVSLSFSPVEVRIARTDCQTVDVLLCLYCLVLLVCVLVEWYEITLKLVFGLAKECVRPVDRLLCGSVRVALKTWTCMNECTSKLKYNFHFSLWTVCFLSNLLLRSLLLFYLLLEVSFPCFWLLICPFLLAGMASDWMAMVMALIDDPQWWVCSPELDLRMYIEAVLGGDEPDWCSVSPCPPLVFLYSPRWASAVWGLKPHWSFH